MPLVDLELDEQRPPLPVTEIPAKIVQPEYAGSIIDTKYTPIPSIIVHIEGAPWTVDYYSQILGKDDELSAHQPTQLAPYQQYKLIRNYELKVSNFVNQSQDSSSGNFTVTGTALTYPFFIPNIGDVFIADMGDGKPGCMTVTNVIRKTIMNQSCFEIDYQMTRYEGRDVKADLQKKVVETVYFESEFLLYGQNPMLSSDDYNLTVNFQRNIDNYLKRYLKDSYSNERNTLVVPNQVRDAYDPFAVAAFLSLFDRYRHPTLTKLKELNCDGGRWSRPTTVWDAMLNLDRGYMDTSVANLVHMVPARSFDNWPNFDTVFYSGITWLVWPVNRLTKNVDQQYCGYYNLQGVPLRDGCDDDSQIKAPLFNPFLDGLCYPGGPPITPSWTDMRHAPTTPVLTHRVAVDDYYIFSQPFYEQAKVGQSLMELLVNDMIDRKAVSRRKVDLLCRDTPNWGYLERYYYIPVLIMLMNYSIRSI